MIGSRVARHALVALAGVAMVTLFVLADPWEYDSGFLLLGGGIGLILAGAAGMSAAWDPSPREIADGRPTGGRFAVGVGVVLVGYVLYRLVVETDEVLVVDRIAGWAFVVCLVPHVISGVVKVLALPAEPGPAGPPEARGEVAVRYGKVDRVRVGLMWVVPGLPMAVAAAALVVDPTTALALLLYSGWILLWPWFFHRHRLRPHRWARSAAVGGFWSGAFTVGAGAVVVQGPIGASLGWAFTGAVVGMWVCWVLGGKAADAVLGVGREALVDSPVTVRFQARHEDDFVLDLSWDSVHFRVRTGKPEHDPIGGQDLWRITDVRVVDLPSPVDAPDYMQTLRRFRLAIPAGPAVRIDFASTPEASEAYGMLWYFPTDEAEAVVEAILARKSSVA